MEHGNSSNKASFEHFEEQCIFDCYDFFLYHKYTQNCKTDGVHSFADALSASYHNENIRHLRQMGHDPFSLDAFRSVAINVGQNLISLRCCSAKLTDRVGEFSHLNNIAWHYILIKLTMLQSKH